MIRREFLGARVDPGTLASMRDMARADNRSLSRVAEGACQEFVLRDRITARLTRLVLKSETPETERSANLCQT